MMTSDTCGVKTDRPTHDCFARHTGQVTAQAPPRGRPRDDRVDGLILDAAFQELVELGPERFSMRSVARRAGVARASLQLRWADADSLMVEALQTATGTLELKDTGTFASDLEFAVTAIAERMAAPGLELMVRVIGDGVERPVPLHQLQQRIMEPSRAAITAIFQRAADRGELRSDVKIDWFAEMIIGGIFMRTSEHAELTPPSPADLESLARQVADLVLRQ
jgi:AcrR family transcriptional regulator